jgi:hypothetical protein
MKKLGFEYIKNYIENKNCKLLSSEYVDRTKLKILFSCGHIGERTFQKFKSCLPVCTKCSGNKKYDLNEIRNKLLFYGFMLEENQKYKNANTKIDFYDNDGYKYSFSMHCLDSAYKRGFTVGRKFEKRNKYALYNINLWIKINNKPYTFFCEEYKGSHTSNIIFKCEVCNFEWQTAWSNVYSNDTGCPFCTSSRGEKIIKNFLDNNNIEHDPQHTFSDCIDKRKLPFDFYLPLYKTAIEFNGIQHFQNIIFFGGEKSLKIRQKHDEIKRNYCKKNKIYLLEISYKNLNNIDSILTKELLS